MGDVAYLDDDGNLFLTGRRSDMLITAGSNVYPVEVEDALLVHPKVANVAVPAIPDKELGETVKAVVQPGQWEDAGPALRAELIAWCREGLAEALTVAVYLGWLNNSSLRVRGREEG